MRFTCALSALLVFLSGQRLYALENGLKPDTHIRPPTAEEFDRKARTNPKKKGGAIGSERSGGLLEAGWSYKIGDRIGQWVFQNLPKEKRWIYLYERSMGKTHSEALKIAGR
ncbi:MAG: hypothetical protein PHD95_05890 [Candidatus ainarchaeum sp.]|nr:hypothetical protein [Candidatus ainarchaeum sp.]